MASEIIEMLNQQRMVVLRESFVEELKNEVAWWHTVKNVISEGGDLEDIKKLIELEKQEKEQKHGNQIQQN